MPGPSTALAPNLARFLSSGRVIVLVVGEELVSKGELQGDVPPCVGRAVLLLGGVH